MTTKLQFWQNPFHPTFDATDSRWTNLSITERRAFLASAHIEEAKADGFSAHGVFPVDDDEYHFAYSTSFEPTIIVTGLSSRAMGMISLGVRFSPTMPDGLVLRTADLENNFPIVFAPVPDEAFRSHATLSVAMGSTSARQLIWQDDDGLWPWSDPDHARSRPVLVGPSWRPTR